MLGLNTCATIAQLLGRILNINRILESGFKNFETEGYSNIGRKSLGGFVLFFTFGFIERFWEKHGVSVSLPTLLSVFPSFAPCISGTHSLQGWASSNTSLLTKVHHFHEGSILCYTLYGFWQMFSVMHVALYWTGSWQSWCPTIQSPSPVIKAITCLSILYPVLSVPKVFGNGTTGSAWRLSFFRWPAGPTAAASSVTVSDGSIWDSPER